MLQALTPQLPSEQKNTENGVHLLCACADRKHWENIVGVALRLSPQRSEVALSSLVCGGTDVTHYGCYQTFNSSCFGIKLTVIF